MNEEQISCECGSKAFKIVFEENAAQKGLRIFFGNDPKEMLFECIVCGKKQEKEKI